MDKGELIDKAKDVLGINDSSVDAKLVLNGKEYAIDSFDIVFQEASDFKGEPQREVKGGLLTMTINQVVDEEINYWMFHRDVSHSGAVVFASFSRIASPVIIIEFINGRCARYTKSIGNSSLLYTLAITAEKIIINGMEHKNNLK
ncbi:MAG TPA: hypothetical protein DEQ30_08000 [Porphyromonadaceae bacterium]|nr:hypothetical protein [Porphyromonadaceae bacterium]